MPDPMPNSMPDPMPKPDRLQQVAAAFERQDYTSAAKLLKQWLTIAPDDLWGQFYMGRLHEVAGRRDAADAVYRQLLRKSNHPKLVNQARQGIERLTAYKQAQRKAAIAAATAKPEDAQLGVLVLEPIAPEARTEAAKGLAAVMQLDVRNAQLVLPRRGWRVYRTGAIGELRFYQNALIQAGVPAFCLVLAELAEVRIFRVDYFESLAPEVKVVCRDENDSVGSLTFDWSEISQRVEGRLPVFEQVVDLGPWGKLVHKEQTLDYIQVCDLHLPKRQCILRLCDSSYQFLQGATVQVDYAGTAIPTQMTTRINWNNLMQRLQLYTKQATIMNGNAFKVFASMVLDEKALIEQIEPYIDIFRKKETAWDAAFQLYSTLNFVRHRQY